MTSLDLFVVRAKTKRGRIVHFLTNFESLVNHKHLEVVQYFDKKTNKWIDFSEIRKSTRLATNIDSSMRESILNLGGSSGNIYYGFEVKIDIFDKKGNCIYSNISTGNPTEYYTYLKKSLIENNKKLKLKDLTYSINIIDYEDWYSSRNKNEKRKGDSNSTFTIIHI